MPIHWAPVIRAIEEAREATGIYETLDSLGVTEIKAAELAGTRTKVVPVAFNYYYDGTVYTAT